MRWMNAVGVAAVLAAGTMAPQVRAEDAFDACDVFTAADAEKALGTTAAAEPVNPKAQHAFDEARMQFQTKPMLISGSDAFWSAKTGQMNVRKGRTWLTIAVGPDKLSERDLADAKKLAELLVQKL